MGRGRESPAVAGEGTPAAGTMVCMTGLNTNGELARWLCDSFDWVCFTRPTIQDGLVLAWAPCDWGGEGTHAVSASRHGVIIGEIYLHEIPDDILATAKSVWKALERGDLDFAASHATHQKIRRGSKWLLEPLAKIGVSV